MKNGNVKYLIPLAFISLAMYYLIMANWIEGGLYLSVGIAFPLMWSIRDGKISSNIKLWNAVSWILVILALLLFIVQLRLDDKV